MLNSGIIYRLLEEKWKAFARVRNQFRITASLMKLVANTLDPEIS